MPDGDSTFRWGGSWDGKTLYLQQNHQGRQLFSVWRHSIETGLETEIYRSEKPAGFFGGSLSPDERLLAFVLHPFGKADRRIMVLPLAGGPPRTICEAPFAVPRSTAWSPDSRSVYFLQYSGYTEDAVTDIFRVSAEGGPPQKLGITHQQIGGVAVHPDGKRLAWISSTNPNQEIWLMENFLPPTK